MAVSTMIVISGYTFPALSTDLTLTRSHSTYELVYEKDLNLSTLPRPTYKDADDQEQTVDGSYRLSVNPTEVAADAKEKFVKVLFYPATSELPLMEEVLKINVHWYKRYPFIKDLVLPVPSTITSESLSITLTGGTDWGYKGNPCEITAEQILAANSGLSDDLVAAAGEMEYNGDAVPGVWSVLGTSYDGVSGICSVQFKWVPEDNKSFATLTASVDMSVTDNRNINLSFLKKGLLSFMGFDNGSITDSVTGNDWTIGKSTSITDSGKVGKGFVLAPNGVTTATANDGNNYGASAESVGLHEGSIACWYNENQINLGGGGSDLLNIDFGFNRIGLDVYVFGNATEAYSFKAIINRSNYSVGHFKTVDLVQLGITNNEYVHLAITWAEDRVVKMFVNGVLKDTWQPTQTVWDKMISQTSDAFGITHGSQNAGGGQGLVDEVGFWDRALSEDEIAALYQAGVDGKSYNNW